VELRNYVFHDNGSPVTDALVEAFTDLNEPAVDTTTTNSDGMWEFTSLAEEPHTIKITYGTHVRWIMPNAKWQTGTVYNPDGSILIPHVPPVPVLNANITFGSYTGNGSGNRLIETPFDVIMVTVSGDSGITSSGSGAGIAIKGTSWGMGMQQGQSTGTIQKSNSAGQVPFIDEGGFRVSASGDRSLNQSGHTYHWVAIGVPELTEENGE
jgi:hypothetical protein